MADKTLQQLQTLFVQLAPAQAQQLLDYAEFLVARYPIAKAIAEPEAIPRPAQESVVSAIKRLAATYPMLDRAKMLNETSVLMTQHVLQGREAGEVIEELEIIFQRHYTVWKNK